MTETQAAMPEDIDTGETETADIAERHRGEASPTRATPQRAKTVKIAITTLLVLELLSRLVVSRVNPAHDEVEQLRQTATELASSDSASTALVIGNPAIADVIDPSALAREETPGSDDGREVALIAPSNGSIGLWSALYDQFFGSVGRSPDALVIGFVSEDLADQNSTDWTQIGSLYTDRSTLADRWADAPDLNARIDITASWASSLVGERRYLMAVISDAIPGHYGLPRSEPGEPDVDATYELLRALITGASADGVDVTVVALPRQVSYDIDPALATLLSDEGATLLDLRMPPGLTEDDFTGSRSLSPDGRALVNAGVAEALAATG